MTIEISWKADYNNNMEYEAGVKPEQQIFSILESAGYQFFDGGQGDYQTYMAVEVDDAELEDIEDLMAELDVEVKAA